MPFVALIIGVIVLLNWPCVGLVGLIMAIVFALVRYVNAPRCSACKARLTKAWEHESMDGGRDMRFQVNHQICRNCRTIVR